MPELNEGLWNAPSVNCASADAVLMRHIEAALSSRPCFKERNLELRVQGGIVHLRGRLDDARELAFLREILSRIKGVRGIWDLVRVHPAERLRVLDIGCGGNKQLSWAIGVDVHPYPGVDVVTDLEQRLPFVDDEVDHVLAIHVLEHIHDLIGLMNELHRIIRPGGILHAMVPCVDCHNAVGDPTHVRFFNKKTFRYFCRHRPAVKPFRPVSAAGDQNTIYVDLMPVKGGEECLSEEELGYCFDD